MVTPQLFTVPGSLEMPYEKNSYVYLTTCGGTLFLPNGIPIDHL